MLVLAVGLLVACLLGYLIIDIAWPNGKLVVSPVLSVSLAVPLGLGLTSVGFFLWLALVGPNTWGLFLIEIVALLGAALIWVRDLARRRALRATPSTDVDDQNRLLLIACGAVLVLSLVAYAALSGSNPHGGWDAVQIWNLRARFLFRAGENWADAFTTALPWSQPNYPVLLPGAISRAWKFAGSDSTLGPVWVAGLFTFAGVGLLASAVAALRGRSQGALAGIVLLGSGMLIWQGATQYADIPLGLFILAALVLIALSDRSESERYRLLALAGLMAGLAGWTKNEGLLFVLALFAVRFLVVVRSHGVRRSVKEMAALAIGLAPVLAVIVGFKLTLAPPNYLVALSQPADIIARLADPARYWAILKTFADVVFVFGAPSLGMPLVLLIYVLAVGVEPERLNREAAATTLLTLGVVLAGYFLVFVTTPYDVQWQLETALYRLVMHLWPGILFGLFLVIRSPDASFKQESPASNGQGSVQHAG
jgi:hypothetical protein